MTMPKFEEVVAAVLAGALIGTTCLLLFNDEKVPEALWTADGGVLMWYFRGKVQAPKP